MDPLAVLPVSPSQPAAGRRIVLASTSPYRRTLLGRLGVSFTCLAPLVDETPRPAEAPLALALRLAESKARAVLAQAGDALVIGSDQVADLEGTALGKPGTLAAAEAQLLACSGRRVRFHTAVCLADATTGRVVTVSEPVDVQFRQLGAAQVRSYVAREQPLDCAGAFKVEGLGIALFERVTADDPHALVGLPLIRLVGLLAAAGVDVLADAG